MKVPGVKINRNEFLKKAFCHYGTVDDFDGKRPIDFFDEEVIDKVARDTINHQTLIVTSTSAVAGIPGGWVMLY